MNKDIIITFVTKRDELSGCSSEEGLRLELRLLSVECVLEYFSFCPSQTSLVWGDPCVSVNFCLHHFYDHLITLSVYQVWMEIEEYPILQFKPFVFQLPKISEFWNACSSVDLEFLVHFLHERNEKFQTHFLIWSLNHLLTNQIYYFSEYTSLFLYEYPVMFFIWIRCPVVFFKGSTFNVGGIKQLCCVEAFNQAFSFLNFSNSFLFW